MPLKDSEARRAYNREYRQKNKAKLDGQKREWEQRNLAKVRERQRQYYWTHRERVLELQAQSRATAREADPEGYRRRKRDAMRRYRLADPERYREQFRRGHVRRQYGLTLEEYEAILARGCAICGTHRGRVTGKRGEGLTPPPQLCLDHDHVNGKVRDALCHSCNNALGLFGEDPTRLQSAADYLMSHRGA